MPQPIATYRTRIALLLDDTTNARYTANQIDQALRTALEEFTLRQPVRRTYSVTADGLRRVVLPADFSALQILGVEEWNADPSIDKAIIYTAGFDDEQWYIEFDEDTVPDSGTILTVKYTDYQTIDGLDSAAGTTIPIAMEEPLMMGAAGYAAQSRAVSRAESINLQPGVLSQLLKVAEHYLTKFKMAIDPPPQQTSKTVEYEEPTGY